MITREEYNEALDVVEAYHKQINKQLQIQAKERPTLWEFTLRHSEKMSNRLFNCILENTAIYDRASRKYIQHPERIYFADMTTKELNKLRRMGARTVEEFKELRGY